MNDVVSILTQSLFIFLSTIGFSILFNVKFSELLYCGFTGLVCFVFYKCIYVYLNQEFMGVIIGTFVATCISRRLAFKRKAPVTVYVIPAIIPLVPGGSVYLTMNSIIFSKYADVIKYSYQIITLAGGIVIGMSIALTLPSSWFNKTVNF